MSSILEKLNNAIKRKPDASNPASLRHAQEGAILAAVQDLVSKSDTGKALMSYAQECGAKIHVLRESTDQHGYFPEKSSGYISCPADILLPPPETVINYISVLRQVAQESTNEFKTPVFRLGRERYLRAQIDRSADIRVWQAEVIYQMYKAAGFTEIIDAFARMGYGSVYEAYKADVEKEAASLTNAKET